LSRPLREWIHLLFNGDTVPSKVLFRVDAGHVRGLSFGHISRCLVIAGALRDLYRSESLFLMRSYADGVEHVIGSGQRVKKIPTGLAPYEESTILKETAQQFRPNWLVVDVPYRDFDTSCLGQLRESGFRILFIDDSRFWSPDTDVVLNSSILALQRIVGKPHKNTRCFLGPEFFVFDESLLQSAPMKEESGNLSILITFGGSDPTGLTLKVAEALLGKQWEGVFFRIVVGPGYRDIDRVTRLVELLGNRFEVLFNPPNLIPFLQACDFAVCNGGRTLYELLYLDKRCLPISSSAHESEVVTEFIRQGIIDSGLIVWEPKAFLSYLTALTRRKYGISR
jgi:spore coat polysaccharide biosynthesis predicted glycosyltransferase SpsG